MSADGAEHGLRLDSYLPYRLSVASNAVSGLIARAYEDRFGLTIPQWRLVCVLAEEGGLTQVQIVARTVMDKVTVSRAAIRKDWSSAGWSCAPRTRPTAAARSSPFQQKGAACTRRSRRWPWLTRRR